MSIRLSLLIFLAAAIALARGGQVNWSCAFNSNNLKSTGAPMDGQMTFELGVFTGGFVPAAANVSSWAANWRRASLAFYNPRLRHFTGVHPVTSNATPFAVGTKGYIWGHDGNCTNGEWILLSAPSWTWPTQNPVELPVNWTVSSASQAVVGQANGSGIHMQTAKVSASLPQTSWAEWRAKVFDSAQLLDPAVSGLKADPDLDGQVNLSEFALGGHPLIAGGTHDRVIPGLVMEGGRQRLTMTVSKRCDRTALWSAQVSTDLSHWLPGGMVTLQETSDFLIVREDLTTTGSSRVFLRPLFQLP